MLSRRDFLKLSVGGSGGLCLAISLPACSRREPVEPTPVVQFVPNAWLRIASDEQVTIQVASSEMGQGVWTALPMLVAEELDIDWAQVRVESAPAHGDYINPMFGVQATGGSTAIRAYWKPMREAGAAAREMLMQAAAQNWGVPVDSCRTEAGSVLHVESGRRSTYGALAAQAALLPVPQVVFLKDPKDFRLIGRSQARLDTPAKVNGSAQFGMDVRLPGMLVAVVARHPVLSASVANYDARAAGAIKGVRHTVRVDSGVAVVADDFWTAVRARDQLKIQWVMGSHANLDSATIRQRFIKAAKRPGAVARNDGDIGKALASAAQRLDAEYEVPYLAHACMEPMTCTVHVRKDRAEVWAPTQAQTRTQATVARIAGLKPSQVEVHTTFLGGGFGRRGEQDFVAEAAQIGVAVGVPVQLIWTREEDMQHDFYRPATFNRLSAGLDKKGMPIAWTHHIVGPSILARFGADRLQNGIDNTSVEGAANIPYRIPNVRVSYVREEPGVPVGFWRSVGSSQNAYVTECFLDEIAAAARRDPYELRRQLLNEQPRHRRVLDTAAQHADWGKSRRGRYQGIALAESFGSIVAQVAEVSVDSKGQVRVHRVVCAIDCGMVVNPASLEAQMESAIVYGLSAVLYEQISFQAGRARETNFDTYPIVRMKDMPEVDVHIVPSEESPGGGGEPGTPPIAPAVVNAVFAATGKPVRRLPIHASQS